ncbi:3-hydroxyisobutyrate dehydrogenase [Deinococcus malanensis]|uniref:3-hydroxyisobutyrate dehydrogenase n=1 Tax=Deinococcus malanensis TaxID=1706855 RepID=A0ABQ2F1Y8_9DEIO|nr:NAD(P)-dependent oxidoreductase [Deinococcus malanensis]GGK32756.1 3-hydroxyisobutyrate dehydrogenase [Deinococcus malanensis]
MTITTAFIGLGAMGFPMAAHLARHAQATGGRALVWNRTRERAVAHAAQYGTTAADLQDCAQAEVLFSCLPTSAQVDEVIDHMGAHLRPGTVWVDCTSGHPDSARRQREHLSARGVSFLDAPVSGGTSGAQAGTLTVMVGGPTAEVDSVRTQLAFAGKVIHVGNTGAGFAVKAINNVLLAVNLWAAGEGLAVLGRHGVNVGAALEVINASSGRSNASENLIGQRVLTREFPVTFTLGLLAKDAGIALDVVESVKGSAPVLAQTLGLYRAAAQIIGENEDHSAALQLIERMNAQEIK